MPIFVAAPLLLALFAASAFPWLLLLRQRFGHLLAIPATAGGALLLLLATLAISHALNLNYLAALIGAALLMGVLGAWMASRRPGILRRPGRYAVALWCPALLGGFIWCATVLTAQFVPGMSRYGWAMNGDALNNLSFADVIIRDNGIALDQSTYSVPLSTALIATAVGAGTPSSGSAAAVLEHHLQAFTLVWVILLVVVCAAVGAVCALLISPRSIRLVALVSALGSLLPLTWFFSGLIIQWGYFNIDVVLPVILAAWIVYLNSKAHPFFAFVCLVGCAVLAFTSWTPMAILVAALGVALVARDPRLFISMKRRYLALIIVALAGALAFASRFINFTSVFSLNGELSATGAGFTGFVNLWWLVPIAAGVVAILAIAVRGRTGMPTTSGVVSLLVAGAATSAMLGYLASGDGEWFSGYYPKKFAWLLLATVSVIVLSFLIGIFAERVRPSLIATFVALALLAGIVLPPGTWPEVIQRQPIARITGDYVRHNGEATVREILEFSTPSHSTVLWQSGYPDEPIVNEWLLLARGGLANGPAKLLPIVGPSYFLYRSSGHYSDSGVIRLCKILSALPAERVVVTANPRLRSELGSQCPNVNATVRVTTRLIGPIPTRTGENWQTDGIEGPFH